MTHRGRNVNAEVSTSFDVRGIARFALLGLALLVIAANARAGDKTPAPFARAGEDLMVASHVRTALRKEERLRPLVPHVRVTKGVAHLSGPVPSAELKKRAVEIAAKVDGVLKVEAGDLYVAKVAPRPPSLTLPLEGDKPTQTQSASPNSLSGALGTLTTRDPIPSAPLSSSPQRVTLMAPEAVAVPSRPAEPTRLTAHPRTSSPASSLPASLERLRRSDVRFRTIRTEVQGTTVRVLTGTVAGEQVMDFARAIRGLPGVQRVIIQDTFARSR
jgi:osmotically-inducible protein OsmY